MLLNKASLYNKTNTMSGYPGSRQAEETVVMTSLLWYEANCINNLSANHTLQLTTLRTSVRELLQL